MIHGRHRKKDADGDGSDGGNAAGGHVDSVDQDMFTVLHGQPAPVVTRWRYRAADPFAITIAVQVGTNRWVEWLVARDLVIDSLTAPSGVGDIRMSPQVVQDYEIVEIEISSADGRAVLEVDRQLLSNFVSTTIAMVPRGDETTWLDMDGEIAKLTQGCWE